jgi:hypothetical protein
VSEQEQTIVQLLLLSDGDHGVVCEKLGVDESDVEQAWLRLYGDAPPVLRRNRSLVCQWHRAQMIRNRATASGDLRAEMKAEELLRRLLAGRV